MPGAAVRNVCRHLTRERFDRIADFLDLAYTRWAAFNYRGQVWEVRSLVTWSNSRRFVMTNGTVFASVTLVSSSRGFGLSVDVRIRGLRIPTARDWWGKINSDLRGGLSGGPAKPGRLLRATV